MTGLMRVTTRLQQLATLNAIGEILNREADFEAAVRPALEQLVRMLELSSGWVFLTNVAEGDSHHGSFSLAAATGLPPALARNQLAPLCEGSCECQGMLQRSELERGVNMITCSRLRHAAGDRGGLEIHASVPLLGQRGPVGILNLAAPGDTRFDEETLAFLAAVGKQLGTAFERSRLQRERTAEARYSAALEERQRLAQEMHDSVAQLLFAAELELQVALEQPDEVQRERALRHAGEIVGSALAELRSLVEVLRPADLSGGLVGALTRLAQRTTGSAVTVHLEASVLSGGAPAGNTLAGDTLAGDTLPDAIAEGLYRIAQEAVHNALRHAAGGNIWLRLRHELRRGRGRLQLRIEDDGRGFGADPSAVVAGMGLNGMRERAAALGGTLTLANRDGGGAVVLVEVPWPTD